MSTKLKRRLGIGGALLLGAALAVVGCVALESTEAQGAWPGSWGGGSSSGGGISTVSTSSPVSGDGTSGAPVTIANNAIAPAKLSNAAAASILGATAAGAHADLTGREALTVVMNGTCTRTDVTGAAATNVDFGSLAGDADGDYSIEYYIVATGTSNVRVQPNQDTTNQASRGYYTNGTTMTQNSGGANLLIAATVNGLNIHGRAYLRSKSGQGHRLFTNDFYGSDNYYYSYRGLWSDSSTVITNVRVNASGGAHIGVGSWLTLCKLGKG